VGLGLVIGLGVAGSVLVLFVMGVVFLLLLRAVTSPEAEPEAAAQNPLGLPPGDPRLGWPDTPALPPHKRAHPDRGDPIGLAISMLEGDDIFRQAEAARWLEKEPVHEKRQAEVVKALKGVIDNHRGLVPRKEAVKALGTWATRADTPYLIGLLDDNDGGVKEETLYVLAKLKDPAAAVAIVEVLPHYRDQARDALKAIGSPAESAVRALLQHPDTGIRIEACRLLKVIGTQASHKDLLELTEDSDSGVAEAARTALPANLRPAVYGPQLTLRVCVVNAGQFPERWPEVEEKLKGLVDSAKPKCKVSTSGDCKWVELSPVRCDAETFGQKIKFAKVTGAHNDPRVVYINLPR
jgi:hypothetical protein